MTYPLSGESVGRKNHARYSAAVGLGYSSEKPPAGAVKPGSRVDCVGMIQNFFQLPLVREAYRAVQLDIVGCDGFRDHKNFPVI